DILQKLSMTFEGKIEDDEIIIDFTNRITRKFENIDAVQSIEVLKGQINDVLKTLLTDEGKVDIYFSRLLTEINFKAVKEKREQRFLDNKILEQILGETDEVIRSGIDKTVLKEFDILGIKIDEGFYGVNQNISKSENQIRKDIDSLGTRLEHQLQSTSGAEE